MFCPDFLKIIFMFNFKSVNTNIFTHMLMMCNLLNKEKGLLNLSTINNIDLFICQIILVFRIKVKTYIKKSCI